MDIFDTSLTRQAQLKTVRDSTIRVLDLFCGAGGMSLGFSVAGCEIVGGIDIESWPIKTHHLNFPSSLLKLPPCDIRELQPSTLNIKPRQIDVLVGSPPCQGLSIAGRGKIRSLGQEESRDEKNRLYKEFIRFVDFFQPKVFVIENVVGMKNFDNSNYFSMVLDELAFGSTTTLYSGGIKYDVSYKVLDAQHFGVPQKRSRLFVVGFRSDIGAGGFKFPDMIMHPKTTLWEAISDLPVIEPPILCKQAGGSLRSSGIRQSDRPQSYRSEPQNSYQFAMRKNDSRVVYNHICRGHNPNDLEIFALLKPGQSYSDLPSHLQRYRTDMFLDKYRRLQYDLPSFTVTAHMQKDCLGFIHPEQERTLSAREAARIQSFPDSFLFRGPLTRIFQMIGNAVPPKLVAALARSVLTNIQ